MLRTITVAHATLDAIDNAMTADDGASFRVWLGRVIPHMDDAYRGKDEGHRSHLGASVLGKDCARAIWYSFRWAHKAKFEPRMMRLFNRGHLEEARFIALLLMIGCEVWQQDANGKQFRISFAEGHGGGSGDGLVGKLPDLPIDTRAVCEFKTHGEKPFIELAGKLEDWRAHRAKKGPFTGQGVRVAKFEHFVQMQLYMRKMGYASALYLAVCKNTDDIYGEIVHLESDVADQFLNRGEKLIEMNEPPKRINESPGFYKCRFCDKRPICHLSATPELNCRTCKFGSPGPNATWRCAQYNVDIPLKSDQPNAITQRSGCGGYVKNTAL